MGIEARIRAGHLPGRITVHTGQAIAACRAGDLIDVLEAQRTGGFTAGKPIAAAQGHQCDHRRTGQSAQVKGIRASKPIDSLNLLEDKPAVQRAAAGAVNGKGIRTGCAHHRIGMQGIPREVLDTGKRTVQTRYGRILQINDRITAVITEVKAVAARPAVKITREGTAAVEGKGIHTRPADQSFEASEGQGVRRNVSILSINVPGRVRSQTVQTVTRLAAHENIDIGETAAQAGRGPGKAVCAASRRQRHCLCGAGSAPIQRIAARRAIDRTGQGHSRGKNEAVIAGVSIQVGTAAAVDLEGVGIAAADIILDLQARADAIGASADRGRRCIQGKGQSCGHRGEIKGVIARAVDHRIRTKAIQEGISIVAAAAVENIIGRIASDRIVAAAGQDILKVSEGIAAQTRRLCRGQAQVNAQINRGVALIERIHPTAAVDDVISGPAAEDVIAVIAVQGVVA